ncbi:MAG: hypothetical protein KTR31_40140 [Myxococcales bacterium]|nr:hypothetical protein [Myxococcales bacterium]
MAAFLGAMVAVLALGLLAGVQLGWFPLGLVSDVAVVVVAGVALIGVTKVPWDLYLQARAVRDEQARSTEIGLTVPSGDKRITGRLLWQLLLAAIALHLVLAAGAVGVAVWGEQPLGWAFAAAYVAATGIRPAWALHRRLSERLGVMLKRATYPRDDVLELKRQIAEVKDLADQVPEIREGMAQLQQSMEEQERQQQARLRGLQQRLEELTGHFESAVARATADADTLKGLRALARLIKQA